MRKIGLVAFIMVTLACTACGSKNNIQPLLDNYDELLKEFCTYQVECSKGYPSVQMCIVAMSMNSNNIPTCPDYQKATLAPTIKCTLDGYKKYGDKLCSPQSPEDTMQFLNEVDLCQKEYDLSIYQECYCDYIKDHAKEIAPDEKTAKVLEQECNPKVMKIKKECEQTQKDSHEWYSCYCEHADEIKDKEIAELMKTVWCGMAETEEQRREIIKRAEIAAKIEAECYALRTKNDGSMEKCRCEHAEELAAGNESVAKNIRDANCH